MSFTPEQVAMLQAPLNAAFVKDRTQAGRKLNYVEGWHCIDEANRIFGFDAWTRKTLEMREVRPAELVRLTRKTRDGREYEVEQWRVGFVAKVRIKVGSTCREGYGFGSGFAADLGDAYESAVKEAETDAMKRALVTFGNVFGLALYDKEQRNVSEGPEEKPATAPPPPPPHTVYDPETGGQVEAKPANVTPIKREERKRDDDFPGNAHLDRQTIIKDLRQQIDGKTSINGVTDLMLQPDTQRDLNQLPQQDRDALRDYAKARLIALGWPSKKAQ